jgi:hypothetical protein
MKRLLFLIVGCVSLGLGVIGIFLPILPTVPFFMLTAFCFAKSSERLHKWFVNSKMYEKHLKPFAEKKGMYLKTKVSIICTVTLLMGFGFFMMLSKGIYLPCGILAVVWICHIIYFVFKVRTIDERESI